MSSIDHVDGLLDLPGESFVRATYEAILGRAPDASGMAYYTGRLRQGFSKESVICQVAGSPEAADRKARLRGVDELLTREGARRGFLRRLFDQGPRIERRIGRLEYRVDALSEKLDEIRQLMRDGARGVAAAPATITATEAPMPAPMAAPVVDSPAPSALTLHAREVLERLLQVRAEGVH